MSEQGNFSAELPTMLSINSDSSALVIKLNHKCGCITEKYRDGIKITPCRQHKENGYVWIALKYHDIGISQASL